jgi:MAX-binding protein
MHNRLEKNRRAHLKQCFDELASECEVDARKASNLTVIKSALKYIMVLRRKEREYEKELADLVQQKIRKQQLLAQLQGSSPASF